MAGGEVKVAADMVDDSFKHDSASATERVLHVWKATEPDLPRLLVRDSNIHIGCDSSVMEGTTTGECCDILPQLLPSMPQASVVTGHTPGNISQTTGMYYYPTNTEASYFADAGVGLDEVRNSSQVHRQYSPDLEDEKSVESLVRSIATHSLPSTQTDYLEQIGPPKKKCRSIHTQAVRKTTSGTCAVTDAPLQHAKAAERPSSRRSYRQSG